MEKDKKSLEKPVSSSESKNKSSGSSSSSSKSKGYSNKTSVVVALRNKFFFMLYRYSFLVFITSILTLITSITFFFFFSSQPVPPQYIPINEDGTYVTLLPISDCQSKTDAEVKSFTMEAINKIYRYDYINYSDQFQSIAQYFTTNGWNDYLESYEASRTLSALKENQWIVTVRPKGLPEYVNEPQIVNNVCTWELKLPLVITYVGKTAEEVSGELFLRVQRVSVLKSQEGLGINRSIFKTIQ